MTWNVVDATSVSISPNIGKVSLTGEIEITPVETTTFVLSAFEGGSEIGRKTLNITVRPNASVQLIASVLEGPTPLTVRFTPLAQSSTAINRLYWEFEGHGGDIDGGLGTGDEGFDPVRILNSNRQYDVTGRDISFTYDTPGEYPVRVRVWDANGNQDEATVTITVNDSEPAISTLANTTQGTAPLELTHRISSYDTFGSRVISYKWDFNGNGTIDYTGDDRAVSYTYTKAGRNLGLVTAITEDGLRVTNQFEVIASASFTFDIEKPSINPNIESTPLNLVSTANVAFELVVMSPDGQQVKTLLGKQFRPAGEFTAS